MSYVVALPEMMSAAATNVASIGSAVATANQGVASATTEVLAAAEDEVAAAIAALFSAHGQGYPRPVGRERQTRGRISHWDSPGDPAARYVEDRYLIGSGAGDEEALAIRR